MQCTINFTKLEGCGNHFILFDCISNPNIIDLLAPNIIVQLCKPNFGIGADGIIFLTEPKSTLSYANTQFEMIIYNADGSLAQMCGNGLRCMARYLQDHYNLFAKKPNVHILTGAGLLQVTLHQNQTTDHRSDLSQLIGVKMAWPTTQEWVRHKERNFEILNLGNPHYVTYETTDYQLREQRSRDWIDLIDGGLNLSFAQQISPSVIELHVHERGCGWTLACGTGATATVFAGYQQQRFNLGQSVEVRLPGGQVTIEIKEDTLWMWGPANKVFSGQVSLPLKS
ncbi:MAG: diaminopimelate epimerase [Myxococcales bacterium]|nr:diaminopimelate epimerase [Myxococcales bacterium]